MKNFRLLFVLTILCYSCNKAQKINGYELNGYVKNMPDSTYVMLQHGTDIIDSSYVMNEKFHFKGQIDGPKKVYVMMLSVRDYKAFWLENAKIDIIGEKGKFNRATVTGSKTQLENDAYSKLTESFRAKHDSLNKLYNDISNGTSHQKRIKTAADKLLMEEATVNQNFIKEHPNSLVSTNLLKIFKTTFGHEITNELYNGLSDALKSSEDGKNIENFLSLSNNPSIGEKFVDFEQENPTGQKIKFSNIAKGKYTLLEFWASWCGPCRKSNPELVEAYAKYKDQGFEIFGVSLDVDRDSWIKAIAADGLTWENVSDLKGDENTVALTYEVAGIPDNVLIDENGIVIARMLRGEDLIDKLAELFE